MLIRRRLPRNLINEDREFFQNEFEREIEPPSSFPVNNAFVMHNGIVFSGIRIVKESLVQDVLNPFNAFYVIKQVMKNNRVKYAGESTPAIVCDYWYNGYFHWLTDALPRLLYLAELGDEFIPVIPRNNLARFIQSTLLPFKFRDICWLEPQEYLFTKKALLVRHTARTGNYNEDIIKRIRTLFTSYFFSADSSPIRRMYVSRAKSSRRKVVNDNEVSALLEEYGFVTVYFEDYSFEEQVRLTSGAEYLVSIHGAGLTNMIFMSDGKSVFEFRPANDRINLCYFSLSSALGLNYYYQFGAICTNEVADVNSNLFINLHTLRINIEKMLNKV